jgi:hypothetical protein
LSQTAFNCFCTFHQGFGKYEQKGDADLSFGTATFHVLYGSTTLNTIHLNTTAHVLEASLDGKALNASIEFGGVINFPDTLSINEGSSLQLILSSPCYDYRQSKRKSIEASMHYIWGSKLVWFITLMIILTASLASCLKWFWILDMQETNHSHIG